MSSKIPSESTAASQTPESGAEQTATTPAAAKSTAAKSSAPKPRVPKPGVPKSGAFRAPTPAVIAASRSHPVRVPVADAITPEQRATAAAFGEVADGVVTVLDGDTKREVGPATGDEPLESYVRAYYELAASAERFHARLTGAELSPKDIDDALKSLEESLEAPAAVGDLTALRTRAEGIRAEAMELRERLVAERKAARAEALAAREAVVVRAEAIAAKPISQVHWKNDTADLRSLLDEWKQAQRAGARVPKDAERALWKRFTAARSGFEKARKAHFAELDAEQSGVASRKEALVAKAEELATSTDWDKTARAFRDLMAEWRTSGRGRKSTDDALWKRFQTAQDSFFAALRAQADAAEEALAGNVDAKTRAVEEAEALVPIRDLAAAKSSLRAIQDRFDAAGEVPKAAAATLARRMGAVEKAIRDAQSEHWNSRNPEIEARATGALAQLQDSIADLERQLAAATSKDDKARLTEALDARRAWLKQIQGVVR